MLKIGFHNPDFPEGLTFDIGGIAVDNGRSVELDQEAELAFYARHGQKVKDYYKGSSHVTIDGKSELTKSDYAQYPSATGEAPDEVEVETVDEQGEPAEPLVVVSGDTQDDEAPNENKEDEA